MTVINHSSIVTAVEI